MKYATKRLIDSVWTLGYEIENGKVIIKTHDRNNDIGYEQEKDLLQFVLIEDDNRIVKSVVFREYTQFGINDNYPKEYEVKNQQHVFSYS